MITIDNDLIKKKNRSVHTHFCVTTREHFIHSRGQRYVVPLKPKKTIKKKELSLIAKIRKCIESDKRYK